MYSRARFTVWLLSYMSDFLHTIDEYFRSLGFERIGNILYYTLVREDIFIKVGVQASDNTEVVVSKRYRYTGQKEERIFQVGDPKFFDEFAKYIGETC